MHPRVLVTYIHQITKGGEVVTWCVLKRAHFLLNTSVLSNIDLKIYGRTSMRLPHAPFWYIGMKGYSGLKSKETQGLLAGKEKLNRPILACLSYFYNYLC